MKKQPISMDVILGGKKHPEIIVNDNRHTNLDLAEIKLANETIKWMRKKNVHIKTS